MVPQSFFFLAVSFFCCGTFFFAKKTRASRIRRKMSALSNGKCGKCGWAHGKARGPQTCPPECDKCGVRHGAHPDFRRKYKLSERRLEKEASPDAHTTAATAAAYKYFAGNHPLPPNARDGFATAVGNNCLIHTLLQCARPTSQTSRAEEEKQCAEIRQQLVREQNCSRDGFLDLDDWWGPILAAMGESPSSYTVRCYAGDLGTTLGAGPRALLLRSAGLAHSCPIWTSRERSAQNATREKAAATPLRKKAQAKQRPS